MMSSRIWEFWANKYERLWAQYFALGPTRREVRTQIRQKTPHPTNILDLGCGVGELVNELAIEYPACAITGIDTSLGMIAAAQERHCVNNTAYHVASINEIGEYGPYDAIVSTNAFPYVPKKSEALKKMYSNLKPNGRLFLAHATLENPYDALFLVFVRLTVSKAQYFSQNRLRTMMQEAGFTIGDVIRISPFFFIPSIYLIEGIK